MSSYLSVICVTHLSAAPDECQASFKDEVFPRDDQPSTMLLCSPEKVLLNFIF